ncbi:hypothetical protein LguiA_024956 [Lonicera macranthoides]
MSPTDEVKEWFNQDRFPHRWKYDICLTRGKYSISKLVADLNSAKLEADVYVVVSPPFVYIDQVKNSLTDWIEIAAQNSWIGKGRTFTGEISVVQLKDIGCKWVIIGHSERRHVIGEDNELLEEREAEKTFDVCPSALESISECVESQPHFKGEQIFGMPPRKKPPTASERLRKTKQYVRKKKGKAAPSHNLTLEASPSHGSTPKGTSTQDVTPVASP